MTKADKSKRRPRGKSKKKPLPYGAKKHPPKKDKFDIDAILKPELKPGQMAPEARSLLEVVRDLLRFHQRRTFLKALCEQYKCSPVTVDRAIAVVHEEWREYQAKDSHIRIGQGIQRYERLAEKAEDAGAFTAARGALDSAHRLAGDMKPDIVLMSSADLPADTLQAEAQRLAEVAARRKKAS